MRLPLIGQNRSIFIGNLGLFWIYFDGLMENAWYYPYTARSFVRVFVCSFVRAHRLSASATAFSSAALASAIAFALRDKTRQDKTVGGG